MKDALKHLKSQNNQLDTFTQSVINQAMEYEDLNKKYVNHQETSLIESTKINKKLCSELENMYIKHNEENLIREQKSKELIQMKASEMERNMSQMLQDLVQCSVSSLNDLSSTATSFTTSAKEVSTLGKYTCVFIYI
jgi:hypothetical protein